MSSHAAFFDQLLERSNAIVSNLKTNDVIGRYIESSLATPSPFMGTGPIRLVILGQDPTIDKLESRKRITTVLSLDQKDSILYRFVNRVCIGLGFSLEENIYATNVCKNFFTEPPVRVKEPDLIGISWPNWQGLLKEELIRFPTATILTLGNPVLRVLVCHPFSQELKHYWGYVEGWKAREVRDFRYVDVQESSIGRRFFPLPHFTNANATELYREHFDGYLSFIRSNSGKEVA